MKRELAFALEAQSHISPSLGRTRSSKALCTPPESSKKKRLKRFEKARESVEKLQFNSEKVPYQNDPVEKPSRRFTRSALKDLETIEVSGTRGSDLKDTPKREGEVVLEVSKFSVLNNQALETVDVSGTRGSDLMDTTPKSECAVGVEVGRFSVSNDQVNSGEARKHVPTNSAVECVIGQEFDLMEKMQSTWRKDAFRNDSVDKLTRRLTRSAAKYLGIVDILGTCESDLNDTRNNKSAVVLDKSSVSHNHVTSVDGKKRIPMDGNGRVEFLINTECVKFQVSLEKNVCEMDSVEKEISLERNIVIDGDLTNISETCGPDIKNESEYVGEGDKQSVLSDHTLFGEIEIHECNEVFEDRNEVRLMTENNVLDSLVGPTLINGNSAVECVLGRECELIEQTQFSLEKGICENDPLEGGRSIERDVIMVSTPCEKITRPCTQSALKPTIDISVDRDNTIEVETFETLSSKMEIKMSKKISVNKIPSNIKELLETGLLEGLPVTYKSGKKGSNIHGIISDVGILCLCKLCKGRQVVAPSKFEFHARKTNRHTAEFICFQNGKNMLEVLKACNNTSLDRLEAAIENVIGPLTLKRTTTCQNCKGSLPALLGMNGDLLCNSCKETNKSQVKLTDTSSSKPVSTSQSTSESSAFSKTKNPSRKLIKNSTKPVSISKLSKNASPSTLSNTKKQWKVTKKDLGLHKLVFEEGGLVDGAELAYYGHGKKLLEGYKKGLGIFCYCCNSEVSASVFEAHAGYTTRRKPYHSIYTSNGVSLHELSLALVKGREFSEKDNDDVCVICADGGDLLLCDGCPRAFHKDCVPVSSIPCGNWYCKYCQNLFEGEKQVANTANAKAAGRISGIDSIEQITKRCIRIVNNPEIDATVCVLCRYGDFNKSVFGERTVILCDQCEKEYHIGCLRDRKMADLMELPAGKWFCCINCRRIHSSMESLLIHGSEKLPDYLLSRIKKKHEEGGSDSSDLDIRWRILSGKMATPDAKLLLSKSVSILHNLFDPIIDPTTGVDLIPCMVYGRNINDQEFGGMYCAILTVNSTVVTAGLLRIFGEEIAELPLVATTKDNQNKGYFQTLFFCIERLLAMTKVKTLVLPAADEAESIWTDKFGFKKIPPDQLSLYRKSFSQLMTFQGTSMLQKMVPECQDIPLGVS